jgi:predicted kinase
MAWVIDGNAAGFARYGGAFLDGETCATVTAGLHATLQALAEQLDWRRQHGFVRQCHGDLHLRNIVLLEGRPVLFDAVEFNDEIACIDVMYDLSFLLMDLWRLGLHAHANVVLNAYLAHTADFKAVSLLPLFLSCRAAVRAKTTATAAGLQADARRGDELRQLASRYLALAGSLLRPPRQCLIAIGGLSGSGKSTLARALAPSAGAVPGALVIRSDEIRKRLRGVPALTRLGAEAYTEAVSARVYAVMLERAGEVVRNCHTAIVDAVFAHPHDREAVEHLAASSGVPFIGLWLDAPEPVLIERSERRRADASDADATVIRAQLAQDTGAITWRRLDASGPMPLLLQHALQTLDVTCRRAE